MQIYEFYLYYILFIRFCITFSPSRMACMAQWSFRSRRASSLSCQWSDGSRRIRSVREKSERAAQTLMLKLSVEPYMCNYT